MLSKEIIDWAKCYSVGVVTNNEIDQWGMSKALKICATRTLKGLQDHVANVDVILLDGNIDFLVDCEIKTELIIKGDNFSHVIACASIIAKVYRDNYMSSETVAGKYKEFYFEKNKGYPAPVHKEALKDLVLHLSTEFRGIFLAKMVKISNYLMKTRYSKYPWDN